MRLKSLIPMVFLAPLALARLWGNQDWDIAELDGEGLQPPVDTTSSTITCSDDPRIQLAKRGTVSVTDWVTVTRDPENPEGTAKPSFSSETLTSTSIEQTPPSWATAATSTASLIQSGPPIPDNSSTLLSQPPSSTSAVSGAPPISAPSSSEGSTASTLTTSGEGPPSTSLAAPPGPVTSTLPIPSESLTEPAVPPSPSEVLPPLSPTGLSLTHSPRTSNTTKHRSHHSTLWTVTTGFTAPRSSTLTLILPTHSDKNLSWALNPTSTQSNDVVTFSDIPPKLDDEMPPMATTSFTPAGFIPAMPTSQLCDATFCSADGTSYCMRWDGFSRRDTNTAVAHNHVFTTVGTCTRPLEPFDRLPQPTPAPLRPGNRRMRPF